MARSGLSQRDGQRQSGLRQQPLVLLAFVLLVSAAMVSRLVWLQVLEGKRYRELADENRIRLVPRSPTRGRLLDRKGRVLASSKLTYSLYVEPRLVDDASWPDLGIVWRVSSTLMRPCSISDAAVVKPVMAIASIWRPI